MVSKTVPMKLKILVLGLMFAERARPAGDGPAAGLAVLALGGGPRHAAAAAAAAAAAQACLGEELTL